MLGKENNWPPMSIMSCYSLGGCRTLSLSHSSERLKIILPPSVLFSGSLQMLVIAFFNVNRISARSESRILGNLFFYMAYKALEILKQNAYIKKDPFYQTDLVVVCIHSHTLLH